MSGKKPRLAFLRMGVRSVLRGNISVSVAAREYLRRSRASLIRRRERSSLVDLQSRPAQLLPPFQILSPGELLKHFRERSTPSLLPGFHAPFVTGDLQRKLFPRETQTLIESANQITHRHRWALLGFGERDFGDQINWNRDPLSGRDWPLDFHADVAIWHNDGSDIRVLWELNRLGHFVTLGRAYSVSHDEVFAEEFFSQLAEWHRQNPVGRGANWMCAMEIALRAMNLLAAFTIFRFSPSLTEGRLAMLLALFEQHGSHIQRNLEFSYVTTSNHYLSDLTGLLWLGIMLPELGAAQRWREWALAELLREMAKQILPDGADYEASTGYHRLVVELFLYSFILCEENGIAIEGKYRQKLNEMLRYLRAVVRPDGFAALIGDTDGGQALPIFSHTADDHSYLLPLGAAFYHDADLILPGQRMPEELVWVLGEKGVRDFEKLRVAPGNISSQAFASAGTYVMRDDDLFLLFNASGAAAPGHGAHRHNDALSIEVSACGLPFIVDPGTYVYAADLRERHRFRSTAYHSTVQVDNLEQNTLDERAPFVIGSEAHPVVLEWESTAEGDRVLAEHRGYERLPEPVRHRRKITFEKNERWWLIEDEFEGTGEHSIATRFHFDAGLKVGNYSEGVVVANDTESGPCLFVRSIDCTELPKFESQFTSRHYGLKLPSITACWTVTRALPCRFRWTLVPVRDGEDPARRLSLPSF
ncbi:MAG: alginate lyase family protein [bacterium]